MDSTDLIGPCPPARSLFPWRRGQRCCWLSPPCTPTPSPKWCFGVHDLLVYRSQNFGPDPGWFPDVLVSGTCRLDWSGSTPGFVPWSCMCHRSVDALCLWGHPPCGTRGNVATSQADRLVFPGSVFAGVSLALGFTSRLPRGHPARRRNRVGCGTRHRFIAGGRRGSAKSHGLAAHVALSPPSHRAVFKRSVVGRSDGFGTCSPSPAKPQIRSPVLSL